MQIQNKSAFTLVELIVVITILAILGTIAFISLQGYSSQARDSKRLTDIQNIKKSLELFALNTGKYPQGDNGVIISYSGDTVWTQGKIGENVGKNLSRNLNTKPLDPLTNLEYTYSVTNTQNQYELLSIYESDLVSITSPQASPTGEGARTVSLVLQTNASNASYPRIDGNYNGVFVKTTNYYIPTPSIINSEASTGTLILNNDNIKSQIITGGKNNIATIGFDAKTRLISGMTLQAFSGVLDTTRGIDNNGNKIILAQKIINAYSGSSLANIGIYKTIVETPSDKLISMVDNLVLNKKNYVNTTSISQSSTYPGCNEADITIGEYTVAACNVGTTIAGTDSASYGNYYQWGNNWGGSSTATTTTTRPTCTSNSTMNYSYFVTGNTDWCLTQTDNVWGGTSGTNEQRQGPCAMGYHVPTLEEWSGIVTVGGWGANGSSMQNALKLPYAGARYWSNGTMTNQGSFGFYWSSSTNDTYGYNLFFFSSFISPSYHDNRANGFSVRCFKN